MRELSLDDIEALPVDAWVRGTGGNNGLQPLLAAAELGRPVVDADGMGRAYPEAQMMSFTVRDLKPWPLSTVDPRGIEGIAATCKASA